MAFDRPSVISTLARAREAELCAALEAIGEPEGWRWLRAPETGLVMVRGRIGGGGSPFNLGKASVARVSARLRSGQTGHAYALGRDRTAAEHGILRPVQSRIATDDSREEAEAAATTVDFYTLVRGED